MRSPWSMPVTVPWSDPRRWWNAGQMPFTASVLESDTYVILSAAFSLHLINITLSSPLGMQARPVVEFLALKIPSLRHKQSNTRSAVLLTSLPCFPPAPSYPGNVISRSHALFQVTCTGCDVLSNMQTAISLVRKFLWLASSLTLLTHWHVFNLGAPAPWTQFCQRTVPLAHLNGTVRVLCLSETYSKCSMVATPCLDWSLTPTYSSWGTHTVCGSNAKHSVNNPFAVAETIRYLREGNEMCTEKILVNRYWLVSIIIAYLDYHGGRGVCFMGWEGGQVGLWKQSIFC